MGGELLLIGNPARRRRKAGTKARRKSSRKASPAQRAARARFAAMSRARSGGSKRRSRRRPALAANPAPRRRRRTSARRVARRSGRRVRRNPINLGGSMRSVVPMLKRASVGAGGAIVNDVAFGYAAPFLPDSLKSPIAAGGGINFMYHGAKLGMAVLMGVVAKKVAPRHAVAMVEGAMIVQLHSLGAQLVAGFGFVPMGKYVAGRLNPGRVVPPLPLSQNLDGRNRNMAMYTNRGSTSMREAVTR